jgi:hypothetical protein
MYFANLNIMKKLLTLPLLFCISFSFAQPAPDWSTNTNTYFSWYVYDDPQIKIDNNGDLVVVGNTFNGNNRDVLVVKYSPSGTILWQDTFDLSGNYDYATDFVIDNENNIIITAGCNSDSLNMDIVTIKYDANGNFKWINLYDGIINSYDAGLSITLGEAGMTYVGGYTQVDSPGHRKATITKIDTAGNTVWQTYYGTDTLGAYQTYNIRYNSDKIYVIGLKIHYQNYTTRYFYLQLDTSGTIIVSNEDTIYGYPGCTYIDHIGNAYMGYGIGERFKTIKIDTTGSIAWYDVIPTNMPFNHFGDEVRAIIVDSILNVYATGRHYGDDYLGPSYTNADILTVKYTSTGNLIWSNRYEYQSFNAADVGNTITIDNDYNVYVAGQSQRLSSGTDYDYVIVKYDSSGNEKGTIRYNNVLSGDDVITSIIVQDSVNIFVTGLTFENPYSALTTQKYSSFIPTPTAVVNNLNFITVNAFPNPFTFSTTILFPNEKNEIFDFRMFDVSGKIVAFKNVNSGKLEIIDNQLPAGFYSFEIVNVKKIYRGKILKL